ncbi:hypothetical protein HYX12_00870 [Candidatus Woesearchaeota archaeon]|nr:hypothetical protein [Candidatus Woesearchaeota archaeon]
MKEVYILERANWDEVEDKLSERGEEECFNLRQRIPLFQIVVSSPAHQNIATGKAITGKKPIIDERAGYRKTVTWLGEKTNETGAAMQGLFRGVTQTPFYRMPNKEAGTNLINLIKEVLKKLPKDGKAIIISHNRNMIAAEAMLNKKIMVRTDHKFHELRGFMVNEKMKVEEISF